MIKIGENIIIEISKDGLKGYITLTNTNKNDIEFNINAAFEEVKKHLKYGLNEELLKRILNSKLTDEKLCIAEGKPSIRGKDGNIKYHFEMDKPLLPKLNVDGTVDYKELDSLNNVNEGDTLATIIPPMDGVDGIMVNGEIIPHIKGKTPKFKYGKNVCVSKDGLNLIAEKSGLVKLIEGKVIVSQVLILENIDNSVGNIQFHGDVIVNKDILNGFTLRTTGSAEIKGAIEGGYIECDGDVLVRQGIQGYNRLTVDTKGNLSTKFIENSIVNVGMNITAEAIMHSDISSNSNILVLGRKGLIVGGICRAKNEIRARIIGSSMATTTVLEVGLDPNIKHLFDETSNKLKITKENLGKIDQSLKVLDILKRSSRLDRKKEELYNDLIRAQLSLSIEINKLTRNVESIKDEMNDLSRGKIKVADTIYPGVKIIIGNSFLYIKDEMKRCTFFEDNGEIRVGPY